MPQISPNQMAALSCTMENRYIDRLAAFIRKTGDTTAALHARDGVDRSRVPPDDAVLKAGIRALLKRAAGHGLRSERALAAFVSLSYFYAEAFDEIPGAQRMLQDRSNPPDDRIFNVLGAVMHAETRMRRRNGF